jgi:hypothetical protein
MKRPAAAEMVAAHAAEGGENPVDEAPPGVIEQESERWVTIKKRAGFCGLCKDRFRDFRGHGSRRHACRDHPESRKLTDDELLEMRAEFEAEQNNPGLAKQKKVESAKARHKESWRPPETLVEAEYLFDFGKHSKRTVKEALAKDPLYLEHLVSWKHNILDVKLSLRNALQQEGLLDGLLAKRPQLMVARAKQMLDKVDADKGKDLHPEIRRLRLVQQIEASEILASHSKERALAVLTAPAKARCTKRKRTSTALVLLPHCSVCGSVEHKRQSCPLKALQGQAVGDSKDAATVAYLRDKRKAVIVSRLKYTQIQIRSPVYEHRAAKMARAPLETSFLSLSRALPGDLAEYLESVGILFDLQSVPCPRDACQSGDKVSFLSGDKVLGKRCCRNERGKNINNETVWHACRVCRVHQSAALHNPLFAGLLGKGSKGVSLCVLAMWNCVEGIGRLRLRKTRVEFLTPFFCLTAPSDC